MTLEESMKILIREQRNADCKRFDELIGRSNPVFFEGTTVVPDGGDRVVVHWDR